MGYLNKNPNDNWTVTPMIVTDSRELWLGLVDTAGNRSTSRVLIDRVEWVATMGEKNAGSTYENPHNIDLSFFHLNSGDQVVGSSTRLATPDGQTIADNLAQKDGGTPPPYIFVKGLNTPSKIPKFWRASRAFNTVSSKFRRASRAAFNYIREVSRRTLKSSLV